jgi:hypothetical protein
MELMDAGSFTPSCSSGLKYSDDDSERLRCVLGVAGGLYLPQGRREFRGCCEAAVAREPRAYASTRNRRSRPCGAEPEGRQPGEETTLSVQSIFRLTPQRVGELLPDAALEPWRCRAPCWPSAPLRAARPARVAAAGHPASVRCWTIGRSQRRSFRSSTARGRQGQHHLLPNIAGGGQLRGAPPRSSALRKTAPSTGGRTSWHGPVTALGTDFCKGLDSRGLADVQTWLASPGYPGRLRTCKNTRPCEAATNGDLSPCGMAAWTLVEASAGLIRPSVAKPHRSSPTALIQKGDWRGSE